VEARSYEQFGLSAGLTAGRARVVLGGCLLVAAFVLRLDGIARPSLATRELHNALLAREYYLGSGPGLPAWKQHVLVELRRSVQPVEPPLLDHAAAWGYRLTGGESLWLPRLISALSWVVGGVFLWGVSRRITSRIGGLVALALYLFWPYGVVISRLYMPDPLMVSMILAGALTVIRFWERPSARRLTAAIVVAALATAIKPGIALIFLGMLFAALALANGVLWRTIRRGVLPVFFVGAAVPTAAYYVYGSYVRRFLASEGDAANRFQPHFVATRWFWTGWWRQLSIVLPFPQQQRVLALVPVAAALAGLLVVRSGVPRAILVGLSLGYVSYAVALAGYTPDNAYYALPLLPILALAIGSLAGYVAERATLRGPAALGVVGATVLLIVAAGAYKSRPAGVGMAAVADYRRIGEITHHTTRAVIVDERLRTPAMYWGWIVGHYWYQPTPGRDLPRSGDPFPAWVDAARASYLIVTDISELRTEPRLVRITRDLPIVVRTDRWAVYDVHGGRLATAAAG
jgi:4-amino-4-deoxy-L-arabinose transferase-like glycosyltransferase